MNLQLQHLISLAILANSALDQFLSYEDATLLAWNSYGNVIRQYIVAGQTLKRGVYVLFVTPPTTASIRAGSPCPEAVTNHELFAFADSLQTIGEPLMDPYGRGP